MPGLVEGRDVSADPIGLEILWTRLIAIADEAATTLVRTSFSPVVRESNDFAAVIFDAAGNAIAENTIGIPSFNMTLGRSLEHFLARRPVDEWREGDVAITNDPWLASGHLPDITVIMPIFMDGRLLGWAGNTAHQADIGGTLWSADTREVFEEGLRIPPMLLFKEGERNEDLIEIIRANVRVPDQVVGDVMAMVAANELAGRRLVELVRDVKLGNLDAVSEQVRCRSDRSMRRAIAAISDGVYRGAVEMDGTGEEPITLAVTITVDGDRMEIDYAGTTPQVARSLNTVMNYTEAYSCYPVKCALDPATPRNGGSYQAITVKAPRGSILNPNFSAAVNARQLVGQCMATAIYNALSPVIPDRVIAESGTSPTLRVVITGPHPAGRRFTSILFPNGGMGARPTLDGLGATSFPSTVVCGAMEVIEATGPLRVWRKEFRRDSGGPGRFRGGLGQVVEVELLAQEECTLSLFVEHVTHPAAGLFGGWPGAPSEVLINGSMEGVPLKGRTTIKPGDRLTFRYPGGGGYGDPRQRDRALVRADLEAGVISADAAPRDLRRRVMAESGAGWPQPPIEGDSRLRLVGVNVGGTFTDIALWDPERRLVVVRKLLTTPDDPTRAIVEGLASLGVESDAIVHGTTLVTNALIERRGAKVGLIATEGYRDVLEIGTELRYDPFDLFLTRPEPLVPRALRLEVRERMDTDGRVVQPLDDQAVIEAGRRLVDAGVEAIAVAFFNAYRNPAHELRALTLLRDAFPHLSVCAAADIAPEIREYERFSTAAANAYVQPLASRYLLKLAEAVGRRLFVMLSDGGVTTARAAAEQPIGIVESGPAAGAMAAAHIARTGGWPEVIAFDMGGTTAKISLIHHGVPQRTHQMEVARVHRFKRGSGLPVRVPVVELIEIGAGGGSLAWTDNLGLLKVGPRSAGAVPGPACYGRGGTEPTVTDADLHLGYLSADNFLGGRLRLYPERAETALEHVARRLEIDRTAVATGIAEIVDNNMATAARIHIAEQGRDPRRYRMVAFGGAGPVHAYRLARLLHVTEVIFPRGAGIASAIGMLVSPRSVEFSRSMVFALEHPDWDAITAAIEELEAKARALLDEAEVSPDEVRLEPQISADLRYMGQGAEITVPIDLECVRRRDAQALARAFDDEYRRRFNRTLPGMPAEVISWRVRALSKPAVSSFRLEGREISGGERKPDRPAYFAEAGGFVSTAVFDRARLRIGATVQGPALIEEAESTVVVGPAGRVTVNGDGDLVMTMATRD